MNKSLRYIVIGIALASILFSLYGLYRGNEFMDVLSGLIIGFTLLGSLAFKKQKKK